MVELGLYSDAHVYVSAVSLVRWESGQGSQYLIFDTQVDRSAVLSAFVCGLGIRNGFSSSVLLIASKTMFSRMPLMTRGHASSSSLLPGSFSFKQSTNSYAIFMVLTLKTQFLSFPSL